MKSNRKWWVRIIGREKQGKAVARCDDSESQDALTIREVGIDQSIDNEV